MMKDLSVGSNLNQFPPSRERQFFRILDDVWEEVAEVIKRKNSDMPRFTNDDISSFRKSRNPPEEMFMSWKTDNITFGDLLSVLKKSNSLRAMKFIEDMITMPLEVLDENSARLPFKTISLWANNFSERNLIGQGGFAKVYKGMKQSTKVAVKLFSKMDKDQLISFTNEVETLSKCKHPYLLEMLHYCDDIEPCIVYEYMENGSLYDFLCNKEKLSFFNILLRIKVAKQVACGLSYLHSINIIHRDIKSSNILLDASLDAKIGDFGTSRLLCNANSSFATTQNIVGTFIYMAPEYLRKREVSPKIDVFSFGMVLAELIEGCPAFDSNRKEDVLEILENDSGPDVNTEPKKNEAFNNLKKLTFDSTSEKKNNRPTVNEAEFVIGECLLKYQ